MDVLAAVGEDQPERHPVLEQGVHGALVDRMTGQARGEFAGQCGGGVRLVEEPEGRGLRGLGELHGPPVEGASAADEHDAVAEVGVGEPAVRVVFPPGAEGVVEGGDGGLADAAFGGLEDVGQVVQFGLGQVIGEAVVLLGTQTGEAEFGPVEVRAEAFDGDAGGQVDRRIEVLQCR